MSGARAWVFALCAGTLASVAGAAEPTVELVTIGPDASIDTRFGHVLLRIRDPEMGRDDAYDFGVAPFHRPDFMIRTVLGDGQFRLRASPAPARLEKYFRADRRVVSQHLSLTLAEARTLRDRLATNLLPENIHYRYDHILDNCATRLRDLLDAVTDGALRAVEMRSLGVTYRDDIRAAGSGRLLALIGLDLLAGARGEEDLGAWQRSFLPRHLQALVASARRADGTPIVARTQVVYQRVRPPAVGGSIDAGRVLVVCAGLGSGLLFVVAALIARRTGRASRWGRGAGGVLLLGGLLSGGLGAVLWPIHLFSHAAIWMANENVALFWPVDLLAAGPALHWIRSGRTGLGRRMRIYLDLRLVGVALLLAGKAIGSFPQDNFAFAAAMAGVLVGLRLQPGERVA